MLTLKAVQVIKDMNDKMTMSPLNLNGSLE